MDKEKKYGGYKTREEQREKHRLWKQGNPDRVRQHNKTYYEKNKDRLRRVATLRTYESLEKRREKREEIRRRVLTHYGNGKLACVLCGESRLPCLSLDHINNDGMEHRRIIKSMEICNWAERNNFPSGFQTLCMNCQWVKKHDYEATHRKKLSKYLLDTGGKRTAQFKVLGATPEPVIDMAEELADQRHNASDDTIG